MESHLDALFEACHKLADVLKDPTDCGKIQLSAEDRNKAREDAHEHLCNMLDAIESFVDFNKAVSVAISIVGDKQDEQDPKQ